MIPAHLGARGGLERPGWVCVAELPVAADVSHVVAAEFVVDSDITDEVAMAAEANVPKQCWSRALLWCCPWLEIEVWR